MRFAGSAPITDFLQQSMDHSAVAQNAAKTRSAVNRAGTQLQGETTARGITAAGEVEAASIVGAAQASVANAQGQAAVMEGIGGIASSAIGAFGGGSSLPAVGTQARATADMKTLNSWNQNDFNNLWKGSFGG